MLTSRQLFFFGSNLYSALGGPSTGYYHVKETSVPSTSSNETRLTRDPGRYITPSPDTFYVWTVINLLFLGFVIFQFTSAGDKCVDIIGWRFAGIGILQSIWVHVRPPSPSPTTAEQREIPQLYLKHHYVVAFVFAILVALVVSHVYWDLRTKHLESSVNGSNWPDVLFIHLPFSLLHAYLVFLLVLSAFTAFGVDKSHHHAGVATKVLVCLALAFLALTAWGYAFNGEKGDVAGAVVLAVMLGGVWSHQHGRGTKSIHIVALIAFIVSLFAVVKVRPLSPLSEESSLRGLVGGRPSGRRSSGAAGSS